MAKARFLVSVSISLYSSARIAACGVYSMIRAQHGWQLCRCLFQVPSTDAASFSSLSHKCSSFSSSQPHSAVQTRSTNRQPTHSFMIHLQQQQHSHHSCQVYSVHRSHLTSDRDKRQSPYYHYWLSAVLHLPILSLTQSLHRTCTTSYANRSQAYIRAWAISCKRAIYAPVQWLYD